MHQYILSVSGRPFSDRDAARIKRDRLADELGAEALLDVVPHPQGGFAVRYLSTAVSDTQRMIPGLTVSKHDAQRAGVVTESVADSESATDAVSETNSEYPECFVLNPAPRAFLVQHVLALVGLGLIVMPQQLFLLIGLNLPRSETLATVILLMVVVAGAMLLLLSFTRFFWTYAANTYRVDREGVEQTCWYFERGRMRRRTPRVNFSHLRTVDVNQTAFQMLLGVGTVKIAAGGTDTYEIELHYVAWPRRLQAEFQRRAAAYASGRAVGSPSSSMSVRMPRSQGVLT